MKSTPLRKPLRRPRRNRRSTAIRNMIAENSLSVEHLIWPLFILPTESATKEEIKTMPGQFRWGVKSAIDEMKRAQDLGVSGFAIFPVIPESEKDTTASQALNAQHPFLRALEKIRSALKDSVLISDIALDPFSSDGHDGLVRNGKILNDETLEILSQMAVLHAQTGVDFVGPSDMMDGRVAALRTALDGKGLVETGILAYSAKYASSFYGPFRDALSSAPKAGDKKTYQMDERNSREALLEAQLDVSEGADIVMVKPGLPYLDVIALLKRKLTVPVAAYNVSGEYAMVKYAALAGALDEKKAALEVLTSFRRAGADLILSYHAVDAARWLL